MKMMKLIGTLSNFIITRMNPGSKVFNPLMRAGYWYISKLDKNGEVTFLNYGYVNDKNLELNEVDEINRYSIQLYHHVVSSINLKDLEILEVGCGRGGGASYIARYLKPKSIKGVDLCKKAIKFCSRYYSVKGLSFSYANALNLPFRDNNFDVIINVESSHCYTDMNKFLREVYKVLKPNGYFLFVDFRDKERVSLLKKQLINSGLVIIKEEKITPNIINALNLDAKRKLDIIEREVPEFLHNTTKQFATVKGTKGYNSLVNGKVEYFYFVLQKQEL